MFNTGFPPEWSTLKKLVWLVGSGIAGEAAGIWKTVSGSLIHITDALASPMQKCEVSLEPIQAGSGDPSPTNVRPITGWTGCEVWVKDEYDTSLPATLSVTFPDSTGTVYGGTVDLVSGVLKVEAELEVFNGTSGAYIYSRLNSLNKEGNNVAVVGNVSRISFSVGGGDQSKYDRISSGYKYKMCNMAKHYFAYNDNSVHWYRNTTLYVFLPTALVGSTNESVYNYLVSIKDTNPLSLWIPYNEPVEIQLTPQEISTLKDVNNVWSNTNGDTTIIYKAQA